jgi:hypothetical protein
VRGCGPDELDDRLRLVDLAAEADQDGRRDVGVIGIAGDHALEQPVVLALLDQAAAGPMGDRDDAVDIGIVAADVAESLADHPHHGRRAVDGRDHEDVVAGADPAVGAHVAVEGRDLGGAIAGRQALDGDLEALVELAGLEVVAMDVLAGCDRRGGKPDDLSVAMHRLAGGARADRDLVAGGDVGGERDRPGAAVDRRAGGELLLGDHHIVVGMQADRGGHA